MIRRLVVLAGILLIAATIALIAATIALIEAFPIWGLIALAVLAWGVWYAMVRSERSPR